MDLTFYRGSADEPWGFRLAGGKDYGQPLTISQVSLSKPNVNDVNIRCNRHVILWKTWKIKHKSLCQMQFHNHNHNNNSMIPLVLSNMKMLAIFT